MPISHWKNITYCIEKIREVWPSSILDVGVGYGRWGVLCREFLDVCRGDYDKNDWKTRIDGIEIFQNYLRPYHDYFYDRIIVGDAHAVLKKMNRTYDLIILGDVLEHFEKTKAIEFLNLCLNKSNYVMLNIPIGNGWEQGPQHGNAHEAHLSTWHLKELQSFPHKHFKVFFDEAGHSFASFLMVGKGVRR